MAVPEQRPMHGLLPCELFDGQHQGNILLVFPLELRPDAARRRLKDERSVPFGAGCPDEALTGFYGLAGDDEHRPADEVGANDRAGNPGPEAVERPGSDVRHRFRRSRLRHQLSLHKVEAGPGKFTALEQGVFSGGELFLCDGISREKPCLPQDDGGPRLLAGRQAHRFDEPDKALQPEQQREKDKASGPEPPPPEKGTDAKEKTLPFLDAQPHPPSAGQSGQFQIMPCGAPGREPAGPGNDVGEVQPACGRSSQQTFDIAVLRRKGDARPELSPFHGRKLLFL